MNGEKIRVVAHSGYKAGERPTSFIFNGQEINVVEILDMWLAENFSDRKRNRFFTVRGNDGCTYTLYMVEKTGEWFLRNRD